MTPLPAVIRKGGFELTMITRVGRAAIYRQHLPGGNPDRDAYEVILPQVRNTDHKGEPVEPYEGYSAAESWGKKGWTFTSLAKAVQKLKELAQKASCAGTVSRKNRFHGRRSSREAGSQLRFRALHSRATISRSAIGQSRQTSLRRRLRPYSVRHSLLEPV